MKQKSKILIGVVVVAAVLVGGYFVNVGGLKGSLNFNDLGSYQKQKYWQYMTDCQPLLKAQKNTEYRTCALNALKKASTSNSAFCTDSDGVDYFNKGIVKTDVYPNGIEDYVTVFNGMSYVMEGACSKENRYMYYQKNCAELNLNGKTYVSKDGVCGGYAEVFSIL